MGTREKGNMKENDLVTIAALTDVTLVHLLKSRLDVAGIQSFIADENTASMNWLYSGLIGGVKLIVRREDAEKAKEILDDELPVDLQEIELGLKKEDDFRCPKCDSDNIFMERTSGWLVMLTFFLLSVFAPIPKRGYICRNCNHKWKER